MNIYAIAGILVSICLCASPAAAESDHRVVAPLSTADAAKLRFMCKEEKLARDVYISLNETWKKDVFRKNVAIEQEHMDQIKTLLQRYGVPDPISDYTPGKFDDDKLVFLHDSMTWRGKNSIVDALKVAAAIEEMDIADLEESISISANDEIRRVYQTLLQGSKEHLVSYVKEIQSLGKTYEAQFLAPKDLNRILDSEMR